MTATMNNITRADKLSISIKIHDNLVERQTQGPAEPGLDAFIPELASIKGELDLHVNGQVLADAARESRLARAETADVSADTWLRHIESFLHVEAHRRIGPNIALARGLYEAACPDGLEHVDERVVDKNTRYRNTLAVLKAPEHQAAIAKVGLPATWIPAFEAALDESDAAIEDVIQARGDWTAHIAKGRHAEAAWLDLMVRLRRYVGSRAKRRDTLRILEGKELLRPLLDTLAKLEADAAARATRRTKKKTPTSTTARAVPLLPPRK